MTAVCPSDGPSEPKPNQPAWVVLTQSALAALLFRRAPFLSGFLQVLLPIDFELSAFCADDPPAWPEWTTQELVSLLVPSSLLFPESVAKLEQAVRRVAWYELCQCVSGSASNPDPPDAPADVPVLSDGPCSIITKVVVDPPYVSSAAHVCSPIGYTPDWIPHATTSVFTHTISCTHTMIVVPRDPRWVGARLSVEMIDGPNPSSVLSTICLVGTAGNGHDYCAQVSAAIGGVGERATAFVDWSAASISSYPSVGMKVVRTDNVPGTSAVVTLELVCAGEPGSDGCCPPDPTLLNRLNQLVSELGALKALVTLIQRQAVPFAYVPDGESVGLTGTGEVALDGDLAVSVLLTTLPGHFGMAEGSPDRIFEVGWVARGTVDGFEAPRPIATSPFLLRVSGDVTRIGYALAPGVVATIRRHKREP